VLDHLRARGADVDICTACYIGDINRVRELPRENPSLANRPSEYVTYYPCSGTPMRNAAGAGHIDIAKLLLEHGASPNPPVESSADAVGIAIARGDLRMIQLLARHGATWEIHMHPPEDVTYADIA
jgi:hypothetical protein